MSNGHRASVADRATVLELLDSGFTQQQVAERLGITKNTVAGIWARAGRGIPAQKMAKHTMAGRLDALHARMDAVLAETAGVGRLPNVPKAQHARTTLRG